MTERGIRETEECEGGVWEKGVREREMREGMRKRGGERGERV